MEDNKRHVIGKVLSKPIGKVESYEEMGIFAILGLYFHISTNPVSRVSTLVRSQVDDEVLHTPLVQFVLEGIMWYIMDLTEIKFVGVVVFFLVLNVKWDLEGERILPTRRNEIGRVWWGLNHRAKYSLYLYCNKPPLHSHSIQQQWKVF